MLRSMTRSLEATGGGRTRRKGAIQIPQQLADNILIIHTARWYKILMFYAYMIYFPCLRCGNCGNLVRSTFFTHLIPGVHFSIKYFWRVSDHVIYILQCPCKLLYVGEITMECHMQINIHKSTIRTGNQDLPATKHFIEMGHNINELKFWVFDHIQRPGSGGWSEFNIWNVKNLNGFFYWISCNLTNIEFKILFNITRWFLMCIVSDMFTRLLFWFFCFLHGHMITHTVLDDWVVIEIKNVLMY